ncbi:hypothetical protein D3C76_1572190 [compost metagenome]
MEAWVAPVLERAVQPGAIHGLGRRNLLQKPQCMGAVAEKPTRPALAALLQVLGIGLCHLSGMLCAPRGEL